MAKPAVEFAGVTKRFGRDIVAVDDLSLAIDEGEYISYIGPSGCGKTTTLRLVSGFEEPTNGNLYVGGREVTHLEPHRRNTAMVFQQFALFPHMTVIENVEFGLKMRRVPTAERQRRALEMLSAVAIRDLANRPVSQLSGGQQQRVGLARALVTQPDILLLDEPLGSIDANLRLRMQRELRRLNKEMGIAFMHVTHTQSEAFAVSDRVVIMNRGRIEQIGTPEEITRTPEKLFVAEFVGKNNILPGEIQSAESGYADIKTAAGTFKAVLPNGRPPQDRNCHIVVRASRPRLLRGDQPAPNIHNVVEGRLSFTIFETSQVELNLKLLDGKGFRVDVHEPGHDVIALKEGTNLRVGWPAEDTHVVFE